MSLAYGKLTRTGLLARVGWGISASRPLYVSWNQTDVLWPPPWALLGTRVDWWAAPERFNQIK
jgi:hypothetical protein